MTEWADTVTAWSLPPVDDVGYLSSAEMLTWNDDHLHEVIERMRQTRYTGWRNHDGLWRRYMALDENRYG